MKITFGRVVLAISVLGGVASLLICLRIEVLNARTGYFLPHLGDGKWRIAPAESMWRKENQIPYGRTLTPAEQERMNHDPHVLMGRTEEALREFVSTYGLLQYLLVPLVFLLSATGLIAMDERLRWAFLFPLIVTLLTGYRMFALSYFGSLGW